MHFHSILFKIDKFTFIMLTIIMSVHLTWLCHLEKSGNLYSKLHRNPWVTMFYGSLFKICCWHFRLFIWNEVCFSNDKILYITPWGNQDV